MSRTLLTSSELEQVLSNLPNWKETKGKIERSFKFKNFIEAFGFMTKVALEAEKIDHHPDWSNSYNKVNICLTTHSSGGISQLDIDLATYINTLYL